MKIYKHIPVLSMSMMHSVVIDNNFVLTKYCTGHCIQYTAPKELNLMNKYCTDLQCFALNI